MRGWGCVEGVRGWWGVECWVPFEQNVVQRGECDGDHRHDACSSTSTSASSTSASLLHPHQQELAQRAHDALRHQVGHLFARGHRGGVVDGIRRLRQTQHSTAQNSTAQHSTAQHSTAQHSTAPQSRAEQNRAEQTRAQQSTAQHSRAEHSRAEHSRAEHSTTWQDGRKVNISTNTSENARTHPRRPLL